MDGWVGRCINVNRVCNNLVSGMFDNWSGNITHQSSKLSLQRFSVLRFLFPLHKYIFCFVFYSPFAFTFSAFFGSVCWPRCAMEPCFLICLCTSMLFIQFSSPSLPSRSIKEIGWFVLFVACL